MISVDMLRFRYKSGGDELFGGLVYSFPPGRITAVTGPSGSGKSTLLYLLGLMLTPTSGRVLWDGKDASSLTDAERSQLRAARVGFVFQDAALDPTRSVAANVAEGALYAGVGRKTTFDRQGGLLDRLGVRLRASHRPGEISGGQAQRVALARALIKRPDIVLADEPTGNLDPEAAQVVVSSLREASSQGAVVVLATHAADLVAMADDRLVLE